MKTVLYAALILFLAPYAAAKNIDRVTGTGVLPAGLPFADATRHGDVLYLSGQIGVQPGTLNMVEGGMSAQAHQVMRNIGQVLRSQGLNYSHLFKCTVMMLDMKDWSEFNQVYATYFDDAYPARSAFGASGLAVGALLEVECMAAFPNEAP